MDEDTSFKEDVEIDQGALDWHFEMQPTLFLKWAERHAQAQFESDQAKLQLDLAKADADAEIRDSPHLFKIEKITEATVANAIPRHPKVKKALTNFLEAKKRVAVFAAAREAMAHKKKALEMLAQLWLGQYPPSQPPREPDGFRERKEESSKQQLLRNLDRSMKKRRG